MNMNTLLIQDILCGLLNTPARVKNCVNIHDGQLDMLFCLHNSLEGWEKNGFRPLFPNNKNRLRKIK